MNHPAFNPYLPSWEYVPDAEPQEALYFSIEGKGTFDFISFDLA